MSNGPATMLLRAPLIRVWEPDIGGRSGRLIGVGLLDLRTKMQEMEKIRVGSHIESSEYEAELSSFPSGWARGMRGEEVESMNVPVFKREGFRVVSGEEYLCSLHTKMLIGWD